MAVLGCTRAQLYAYPEEVVNEQEAQEIKELIERRAHREPLQYILGHASFFGLVLVVTPAVLIPRPETEQAVEKAVALLQHGGIARPRVLDIGTGSGCIALAIKSAMPEAEVHGCDVSKAALDLARTNADQLRLGVRFHQVDVLRPGFYQHWQKPFDLLISNPPYVPISEADTLVPEVRDHEPSVALYADPDPLQFYKAITRGAEYLLGPGGFLIFETHATFGASVKAWVEGASFQAVQLHHDLAGLPRIITAQKR